MTYIKEFKLNHDESPAKINKDTGEITILHHYNPNIAINNKDLIPFKPDGLYNKHFKKSWDLLQTQLSDRDLRVVFIMSMKAKPFTNSLEPLNDDSSLLLLSEELGVSRNEVSKIVDRLFKLGIFGKFELYEQYNNFKKYWIFNPYISFSGNKVDKHLLGLFSNTVYAQLTTKEI